MVVPVVVFRTNIDIDSKRVRKLRICCFDQLQRTRQVKQEKQALRAKSGNGRQFFDNKFALFRSKQHLDAVKCVFLYVVYGTAKKVNL